MTTPTTVFQVRFKAALPEAEVRRIIAERTEAVRALPGLLQKYDVRDDGTGEYGGLYLWDSPEALDAYRVSDLRAGIAAAHQTEGDPRVEVMTVLDKVRD